MDKIKAQQLNNLGDQLTATRDEIYQMGHQFEELIVQVSLKTHTFTYSRLFQLRLSL